MSDDQEKSQSIDVFDVPSSKETASESRDVESDEVQAEIDTSVVGIGASLREARLAKGLTTHQIAEEIRVSNVVIEAIEDGTILDQVPIAYVRGFVRSFAQIVGLDGDILIRKLDTDLRRVEVRTRMVEAEPEPDDGEPLSNIERNQSAFDTSKKIWHDMQTVIVSITILTILVFLGVTYYFYSSWNEIEIETPGSDAGLEIDDADDGDELQFYQIEAPEPAATEVLDEPESVDSELLDDAEAEELDAVELAPNLPPENENVESSDADVQPVDSDTSDQSTSPPEELETEQAAEEEASDVEPTESNETTSDATEGSSELLVSFTGECWIEIDDADGQRIYSDLHQDGEALRLNVDLPIAIMLGNYRDASVWINSTLYEMPPPRSSNARTLRFTIDS